MKDPYVYKGTNILVNTLNIKEYDRLEFVEKEITTVRFGSFHVRNLESSCF